MRVDLHVHTSPRSPCSVMEPLEAVRAAARLGLDAVCLTDHHRSWRRDELDRLEDVASLRVFGGTEITTPAGDILVFGLSSIPPYMVSVGELRRQVVAEGGIMVAAHPFRGAWARSAATAVADQVEDLGVFDYVDAVEVCNGCSSETENAAAARAADRLGLPGVAGSDAHRIEEIGRCVTVFEQGVEDVYQLAAAVRRGRCSVEWPRWVDRADLPCPDS